MAVADPSRVLQVLSTADQEVLNAAFRALAHTEIYQILGRMGSSSAA